MEFKGKIFKPSGTKPKMILAEKLLWFGMTLAIFSCIILILNDNFFNISWVEIIFKSVAMISIPVALISKLIAMSKNEPLNGGFDGLITITKDFIKIDEQIYNLKDLSNFELCLVDYTGKMYSRPNYPGPWGANGADNKICFSISNDRVEVPFIIQNETEFEILKKIKSEIKNTVANTV